MHGLSQVFQTWISSFYNLTLELHTVFKLKAHDNARPVSGPGLTTMRFAQGPGSK